MAKPSNTPDGFPVGNTDSAKRGRDVPIGGRQIEPPARDRPAPPAGTDGYQIGGRL